MKEFFEGIAWLFEEILFFPLDLLRSLSESQWNLANIVNWSFVLIGFVAMAYWISRLNTFNKNNEEDKDPSAHSFL